MIKRRFYRQDRGDKDDGSSSDSSSSSDSDADAHTAADSDADSDAETQPQQSDDGPRNLKPRLPSPSSSGYESEDGSEDEIDAASPGFPTNDDDSETEKDGERPRKEDGGITETLPEENPVADDIPICILKSKSVFKCRLCPKIVCLNKESLNTHLQSKRHARSEKLLKDGKLKLILNSDGEEVVSEDDGETHAERHARIIALAQLAQSDPKKKSRGRQRQRERLKRKNCSWELKTDLTKSLS